VDSEYDYHFEGQVHKYICCSLLLFNFYVRTLSHMSSGIEVFIVCRYSQKKLYQIILRYSYFVHSESVIETSCLACCFWEDVEPFSTKFDGVGMYVKIYLANFILTCIGLMYSVNYVKLMYKFSQNYSVISCCSCHVILIET
jgi:hypothetical protein